MLTYEQSLARIAINICASLKDQNNQLREKCYKFAKQNFPLVVRMSTIDEMLTHRFACEDFYSFNQDNGAWFESLQKLKSVMREVWLYRLIISKNAPMTADELKSIAQNKFSEEQEVNPGLLEKMFGLDYVLKCQFDTDEKIERIYKPLQKVRSAINLCLDTYGEFYEDRKNPYMAKLFGRAQFGDLEPINMEEIFLIKPESPEAVEETVVQTDVAETSDTHEESVTGDVSESPSTETDPVPRSIDTSVTETESVNEPTDDNGGDSGNNPTDDNSGESANQTKSEGNRPIDAAFIEEVRQEILRSKSQIEYLERMIHDKDVKLQHSEKDAVRVILTSMVSEKFGSPLNELFLCWKDEKTPDDIKRIISNLFLALESVHIKPIKAKLVGQEIQLTDENAGSFIQMNGDQLTREDRIKIRYPGYRFDKETMIRPMVQKMEDSHE